MKIEIDNTTKSLLLLLFGVWMTELHSIILDSDPKDYWLFYNPPNVEEYGITRKTFIHYFGQHVFIMSFVIVMIYEAPKLRDFFKAVLVLESLDLLDYLLFYHYSYLPGTEINFTSIKIIAYTALITYHVWRQHRYSG
jgi:hypothetical protein